MPGGSGSVLFPTNNKKTDGRTIDVTKIGLINETGAVVDSNSRLTCESARPNRLQSTTTNVLSRLKKTLIGLVT